MDNYKNEPQYLYGLTPSQMDMFMTEDIPVRQQAERVSKESISSSSNYLSNGGMWTLSGMSDRGPSKCSMSQNYISLKSTDQVELSSIYGSRSQQLRPGLDKWQSCRKIQDLRSQMNL